MATLMCVRCDTGAPRCLSVLTAEKRDFPAQVREDGPCQDVRPKARSGFGVTLWGGVTTNPKALPALRQRLGGQAPYSKITPASFGSKPSGQVVSSLA